jgi:mRNA interferase MazF
LSYASAQLSNRRTPPRIFRPTITVNGEQIQVLIEQTSAVAPARLGDFVGRVTYEELVALADGLRLVLALD